ncbi:Apolipoprotein O [Ceraceosorus bombacis]|uniref:MICOS complex subunit n=1 Tax=Ceraceosorus bombacis TaxID=401625 RepID=A0A0P1BAZ7_9BASI|nr:Apolipoprotein O [Ceraceosorus bombacis]
MAFTAALRAKGSSTGAFAALALGVGASTSTALLMPVLADGHESHKLPIYPQPTPPVTLIETHTALEGHVGDARRALQSSFSDLKGYVQSGVSRWIGVERAVENRVSSLVSDSEPLTPGILYIGVATLASSVFTRYRALPLRLLTPPLALVVSSQYFLPKTTSNVSSYYVELEGRHFPAVKEHRESALQSVRGLLSSAGKSTKEAREEAAKAWKRSLKSVEDVSGLKVAGQDARDIAHQVEAKAKSV